MSENKMDSLARDVLKLARNTLLVNLRFLDMALSRFTLAEMPPMPDGPIATDGHFLLYHPRAVLDAYRSEKELMTRNFLHSVFHCVFAHPFVGTLVNKACWDLACDVAVENAINELGLKCTNAKREMAQRLIIASIQDQVSIITAEKVYRYYLDLDLPDSEYIRLRKIFCGDSHTVWYIPAEITASVQSGSENGDDKRNEKNGSGGAGIEVEEKYRSFGSASGTSARRKEDWQSVAQRMQTDLETFSKRHGDTAGSMTQNLKSVTREKYDYADFLWHFATYSEAMKINDDEFDYNFYTYGMQLYGKMPLIEPLEYKDVRRIKEFVIAIDTSGSVQGDEVQRFVQKTYNILKQQESFFTKINLHIIQCDAEIQEHVKITSQEEFDTYINTMTLRGFGGTDFRPVFRRVDELIEKREFQNLKGMIYFTDGYGTFPERMPDYLAAFVFVRDDYETPEVPVWAIRLVLQKNEL